MQEIIEVEIPLAAVSLCEDLMGEQLTQKPFVQEKKMVMMLFSFFHCNCWLSNEDDEKLGDTKWAGTHLSSAMKSTTPTWPFCHTACA